MMSKPRCVAVLDVMWSDRAADRGPRWFSINPDNHSGRRLYKLTAGWELIVTNACPQVVTSARGRGVPDPEWLRTNLDILAPYGLLLVCGKTAIETYDATGLATTHDDDRVLRIAHPAWRGWTKVLIDEVAAQITTIREGLT